MGRKMQVTAEQLVEARQLATTPRDKARFTRKIKALLDNRAHVDARLQAMSDAMAPIVAEAVEAQRRMTGATGAPESPAVSVVPSSSSRRVPDPSLTDALYYAERAKKPNDPHIGRVWVEESPTTRIGALAFIRRKLGHHEQAAEWFKNAYEALYGGLAPAIDMSKVRVDTSIMAHDNGAVARLDRSEQLRALIVGTRDTPPRLPKAATDRIVACVVLGIPCNEIAAPGPSGKPSGHAVEREVGKLLDALDFVAEELGFKMRGAA